MAPGKQAQREVSTFGFGERGREIKMKDFGKSRQQVLEAINHYYVRYRTALEYRSQKRAGADAKS